MNGQSNDLDHIEFPEGTTEAERLHLLELVRAFDQATKDLKRDHTVVFPSNSERLRMFFDWRQTWSKQWHARVQCMFPGCSEQSIQRSHTIPMSASLKAIAEGGHVVAPRFTDAGMAVTPIGVREASTFPGFCEQHEQVFGSFESQKQMTTAQHFTQQAFRTLSREVHTQRHHRDKLNAAIKDYRRLRDDFIESRLRAVPSASPLAFNGVEFENADAIEDMVLNGLHAISTNLPQIERLQDSLSKELVGQDGHIAAIVTTLDLQLPVCLSGVGAFHYRRDESESTALCFLVVVPETTETKIMIGTADEHEGALQHYWGSIGSMELLERIESWMCNGSDHWFMSPSAWALIPQNRKEAICGRILDDSFSIGDPLEFSILDGPRRKIVEFARTRLEMDGANGEADEIRRLIEAQTAKLNWTG